MDNQEKWDSRFLRMAELVASFSKDPSTRCGAVITKDKKIVSLGFNGFPSKLQDDERLLNREEKYKKIIHAELNSIIQAKQDLTNCTIFTFPFQPCHQCSLIIVQCGITRVVAPYSDNPRWIDSFKISQEIFQEAEVELTLLDDRDLIESYYDDSMDGDHKSALASCGWGTDEDYSFGGDEFEEF